MSSLCSAYNYIPVIADGCMPMLCNLGSTVAAGNVLNLYNECFFTER